MGFLVEVMELPIFKLCLAARADPRALGPQCDMGLLWVPSERAVARVLRVWRVAASCSALFGLPSSTLTSLHYNLSPSVFEAPGLTFLSLEALWGPENAIWGRVDPLCPSRLLKIALSLLLSQARPHSSVTLWH